MKINIEIIDRLYEQIKSMCDFNNITVENYIIDCVTDAFNIMKYGDLNEKIQNETTEKKLEEKTTTNRTEEKPKKKVGRPKKVKEEKIEEKQENPKITPKETISEPLEIREDKGIFTKEQNTDTTDRELQNKIIRVTKRTLKTK